MYVAGGRDALVSHLLGNVMFSTPAPLVMYCMSELNMLWGKIGISPFMKSLILHLL